MDVNQFVEEYNKRVDWNHEIIDEEFVNKSKYIEDIVLEWISFEKITKNNYDLENGRVYEDHHKKYGVYKELQIHSYKTCGTHYFWIYPSETEEIYKKRMIGHIKHSLETRHAEICEKIKQLNDERNALTELEKLFEDK